MEKKGQISGAVGRPLCRHRYLCMCVCVCLRGDSVLVLMGTKLIRDFACAILQWGSHRSQDNIFHLSCTLHYRDSSSRHLKQFYKQGGKKNRLGSVSEAGSVKGAERADMKRRRCWILCDFDILFNPFLPFYQQLYFSNASGGFCDHKDFNAFVVNVDMRRILYCPLPLHSCHFIYLVILGLNHVQLCLRENIQ